MTEKLPIITVTCLRDLALLDLQAQGVSQYLDTECPVYLIVNEENPTEWNNYFNEYLRHYYDKHHLTILYRADFEAEWNQWIPSPINPWAVGWETQQILKLAIAKMINSVGYVILDSQNFLIRAWNPNSYNIENNQLPYRSGHFTMPLDIWKQYSDSLKIDVPLPTSESMSMCTPIFMHTGLVQGLLDTQNGVLEFSKWFKCASKTKSEFILYALWAEKNSGISKWHYKVEDYANPYLRDSNNFEADFEYFIGFIGEHRPHVWASANHRSWGDMTDEQYLRLKTKLLEYNLVPHFDEYRATYTDIKI